MHTAPWSSSFDKLVRAQLPLLAVEVPLPPDQSLFDLGLGSAGMVALLAGLEDEYDIVFGDDVLELELFSSAGTLWETVQRVVAQRP